MNLQEMQEAVRAQLDLDEVDLPNDRINLFLQEGFDRTVGLERDWPFLEKTWSWNSYAEQRAYDISTVGSDVYEIVRVMNTDENYALTYIPHNEAVVIWNPTSVQYGKPYYYSFWDDQIHLWPIPDDAYALSAGGYREPSDWIAGGAATEPDCDSRLHIYLVYFACSRALMIQEDDYLAQVYENMWMSGVLNYRKLIMSPRSDRPRVFGAGTVGRMTFNSWLRRAGDGFL